MLSPRKRAARRSVVFALFVALLLFWTVPVAFVSSLTSLEAIRKLFPLIDPILDWSPLLSSLLQSFLPGLALMLFQMLLPSLLRLLVDGEHASSESATSMSVLNKYFVFQVFSNFFVVTLAGTALTALQAMIDEPSNIPVLVATGVPAQSDFFTGYILQQSLLLWPYYLLNPLGLLFGVQQKRDNAVFGDVPVEVEQYPEHLDHGVFFIRHLFCLLLALVFAPVAPLLLLASTLYFGVGLLVQRYQLTYFHVQGFETGGEFFPLVMSRLGVCVIVSQLVLFGLFTLRGAITISLLALPLPFITLVLFNRYAPVHGNNSPFHYLSLEECQRLDVDAQDQGRPGHQGQNGTSPYALWIVAQLERSGYTPGSHPAVTALQRADRGQREPSDVASVSPGADLRASLLS